MMAKPGGLPGNSGYPLNILGRRHYRQSNQPMFTITVGRYWMQSTSRALLEKAYGGGN